MHLCPWQIFEQFPNFGAKIIILKLSIYFRKKHFRLCCLTLQVEKRGKSVIIFEPDTNSFDASVPSLIHARSSAACAVFKSPAHNLRPVVLVVGGIETVTAEVYDFTKENSTWTESKI